MGHGERHCAQPVALGDRPRKPAFAARETLPGRQCWNPAATGAGRIDGVAKVTGAKLYASDFRAADLPGWPANTSHAMLIRAPDATHVYTGIDLSRLSGALKPSVVVTAADLAQDRHPRSRILCRRPVLPGRQDAALSRPAGGAADLRDVRRLRSGAAGAARRHLREIRRGNRPGRDAELRRLSLHARGRPDARRARCLLAVQEGWVSPGSFQNSGRPVWAPLPIRRGRAYAKAATYGEQIRAELAANNPALLVLDREFETQSDRPDVSRAGRRSRLVRRRPQEPRARARRAVAVRGRGVGRVPARRGARRPSSRRASTRSSPISAAASAAATIRRSRSMSRWRRCSSPAARSGSRTTAISSSRRASSGTRSRCARGSASIAPPARSRAFAADHVLDGGGLANFSASVATSAPPARSASTTFRRSTSPRSRSIRAA